jgi:hypothetical protein
VKTNTDLIDANTSKQVSPTNLHVWKSDLKFQGSTIVFYRRDCTFQRFWKFNIWNLKFWKFKLQKFKLFWKFKKQNLKFQIETSEVQVLNVHTSNIELSKVHVSIVQVLDIKF